MARKRLPPGFRFHPTDVELILYYLKRKVMGKKLHYEAIAEVNIYKFSPWDLPDKSCLKNKDREWFFFCPREKKYASGIRVKRATENGYWKTTGRDRKISCNEKTVGTVKTLVFHLGNAPKGERTDWIIHEYKILDEKLAEAGVQDTYVLCKVFKKNGPGPKNGAQYGAPFNEADWADDDLVDDEDDDGQNHTISLVPDNPSPPTLLQTEEQSVPLESGLFRPGNTSGFPLLEEGPSHSVGGPTSEVVAGEADDEMTRLLAQFTDDAMLGENGINQDDLSGRGMNDSLPSSDGLDVYNDLDDLDSWCQNNEGRLDFSGLQNDGYFLNGMLPLDDSTYIELDDLLPPLHHPDGVTGTDQLALPEILGSSHSHDNMQHFQTGANFVGMNLYASCTNVLPVPPDGSYEGDNHLDVLQMVDNQIYQGPNASYDFDFSFGQMENAVYPANNMERGSRIRKCYSRLMERIAAHLLSAAEHFALSISPCGGSSIHIKAEVTHGAGECTDEALSLMMGGSSSCWCNLPWAVFLNLQLWVVNRLLYLMELCFCVVLVYCYLTETVSRSYYHVQMKILSILLPQQPQVAIGKSFLSIVTQHFPKYG